MSSMISWSMMQKTAFTISIGKRLGDVPRTSSKNWNPNHLAYKEKAIKLQLVKQLKFKFIAIRNWQGTLHQLILGRKSGNQKITSKSVVFSQKLIGQSKMQIIVGCARETFLSKKIEKHKKIFQT